MGIGNDTVLVCDRGNYTFAAQKLGEKAKKVYYCMPDTRPYPETKLAQIGCDLPEIERIDGDQMWKVLDKCDWAAFFDVYDCELQQYLLDQGMPVFGCLGSAKVELDRTYFLDLLKGARLPIAKTTLVRGVSELLEELQGAKGIKYLKGSMRGDFETKKFRNVLQIMPWVNDIKKRLGEMAEEIDILIQDEIKAECEAGWDGFNVNGTYVDPVVCAYEVKDKGLVGCIMDSLPEIMQPIAEAFSPTFKKLGYRGNFSTELRITKDGKVFFTDPTCRVPKPPGHVLCEVFTNWAEMIREIARGEIPEPEFKHRYLAEYILHSSDHEYHEIFVEFPKDCSPYVKLINQTKEGKGHYIIENGNGGYFGGVIGMGDTMEEAIDQVKDVMGEIEADGLDYEPSIFDEASETVEAGRKFGIEM